MDISSIEKFELYSKLWPKVYLKRIINNKYMYGIWTESSILNEKYLRNVYDIVYPDILPRLNHVSLDSLHYHLPNINKEVMMIGFPE